MPGSVQAPALGHAVTAVGRADTGGVTLMRDPFRVLMALLTIVTVSRVHQQYPILAAFRPAMLLVVAATAYAFLIPRALSRVDLLRYWPMRRVGILVVLACFSAGFGISLGGSALFILDNFSKTVLYCVLLALAIRNADDLYTLVWAYVISCAILAFFAFFVFQMSAIEGGISRLGHLYTYDSNDLCVVLLVGMALTMLLLHVETGSKRVVLVMILIGIGGAIARSGSRGGFVGLAAFGLAALAFVTTVSASKKLMAVGSIIVALTVFAPSGYWGQMGTILSLEEDYNFTSLDGRKAVAERGLGYMMAYPVFGLGISNFDRAECTIANKNVGNGRLRCTAPHNSYIEAGAELGFPGLIVWSSIVLGGIAAMVRLRRRLPGAWRRGTQTERFLYNAAHYMAVALVGFAASALFVSFAWIAIIYILAAFMTGLYVSVQVYKTTNPLGASSDATPRVAGWRVARSTRRFADAVGVARG